MEKDMTVRKKPEGRLLTHIDCSDEFESAQYFEHGAVKVVPAEIGSYREAEDVPLSRFGYRFNVEHIGKPHTARITFPDDRRRFMCIMDGTSYDLSTGLHTGFAHPLSGCMQTIDQVFWPRWTDCSIVFMTWGHGEPAAVASISVYELDDLAPLHVENGQSYGVPRRTIGIQYEDPCGTGASEGALTRSEWMERVLTYARHTGQSELAYPLAWYHGPHYPADAEPCDDFDVVVGRDRRQYIRWTTQPGDWVTELLDRCSEQDVGFTGVLTLLRLGSLMQQMNIDEDSVARGVETINNVRSSGRVQAGTMDWTTTYNCLNYPDLVAADESVGVAHDFEYAYGEKTGGGYPAGPIFNVLHPTVQDAIARFVREIADRYGSHPAFRGLNITMWVPTILWFGSIDVGYDDYTVGQFTHDTGIDVPGEEADSERFRQRYDFLMRVCPDAWIEWRCQRIHEFVLRLRDELHTARPDLVLGLDMWSEPFIPAVTGAGGVEHQIGARKSTVQLYREAGIDPSLYESDDGIRLTLQLEGGGRDRGSSMEDDAPLSKFTMYRDHDYLDDETLGAFSEQANPGAFIMNAWHEAWGTHKWFAADEDDAQTEELATMSGEPAEGIFRINSAYPEDGFWWDSQLRITPAFPAPPHFMEQYAHAVAELDAHRITRGGLFLDKAHSGEIQRFAQAFQALPAVAFETVDGATDPVAVRWCCIEGKSYAYAVNREPYDCTVEIRMRDTEIPVTDLASGEVLSQGTNAALVLGPYELRSVTWDSDVIPASVVVSVPEEIRADLAAHGKRAREAVEQVSNDGLSICGANRMVREIEFAIRDGRYAKVRRALGSYPILRALELTQ
jgi:hypothetical protein